MVSAQTILKELKESRAGKMALWSLGILYFFAIFAPFFAPYEVSTQQLEKAYHPPTLPTWDNGQLCIHQYKPKVEDPAVFVKDENNCLPLKFFSKGYEYKFLGLIPSSLHFVQVDSDDKSARLYILGSDALGRDVFSRLLYGSQISLSIGFIGISITMVLGFLIGATSGYAGGKTDFILMRLVELLMAIPGLYLLLALRSALAPYFEPGQMYLVIIIILSVIGWSGAARIIRGMTLSLSRRTFVLASEVMGQSSLKILTKHILPNLISYLLVAATLSIPGYILGEAALSFLGLGIQEPSASWGLMLKQAQQMRVFMLNYWWMLSPGVLIFITVISFNVLGDVLRDIVDPKLDA